MTIGDIFAVIAAVLTIAAGWAATILLAGLFFPGRVSRARIAMTPLGPCAARGFGICLVSVLLAVSFAGKPGPLQLIGAVIWASLGATAALGSAALVGIVGERIQGVGTHMTSFHALTRGAALYVVSGLLPVIGWFFIAPFALIVSVGAGASALRRERRVSADSALPISPAVPQPYNAPVFDVPAPNVMPPPAAALFGAVSMEQQR